MAVFTLILINVLLLIGECDVGERKENEQKDSANNYFPLDVEEWFSFSIVTVRKPQRGYLLLDVFSAGKA